MHDIHAAMGIYIGIHLNHLSGMEKAHITVVYWQSNHTFTEFDLVSFTSIRYNDSREKFLPYKLLAPPSYESPAAPIVGLKDIDFENWSIKYSEANGSVATVEVHVAEVSS